MTTKINGTIVDLYVDHGDDQEDGVASITMTQPAHVQAARTDRTAGVFVPAQSLTIEGYLAVQQLYEMLKQEFEKAPKG